MDVVFRDIVFRVSDQWFEHGEGFLETWRAPVSGDQRLQNLGAPVFLAGINHLVDRPRSVEAAIDRRRQPAPLAVDHHLDSVRPRASTRFRILHVIKQDEDIRASDLVEISQPREEVRLMDGDQDHSFASSMRNRWP